MARKLASTPDGARRYDIDVLRAGALSLLIVFHVLSVFAIDRWVVKHQHPGIWADTMMAMLSPWRMSLVFFVGGVALRYLMNKVGPAGLIRDRIMRLGPPFLLAIFVLVPPAEYLRQLEWGEFQGSFWSFMETRAWVAVNYHGLVMPAQQHAWFLPYLFVYAAAAGLVAMRWPTLLQKAQTFLERHLVGWSLVLALIALFMFADGVVNPYRQRSVLLFTDFTGHLHYAPVFALGFILARSAKMWGWLAQHWRALVAATIALAGVLIVVRFTTDPFSIGAPAMPCGFAAGAFGGAALLAIAATAHAWTNRPYPWLAYINDAILPIYVLHMLFLVVPAHFMRLADWPVWAALPTLMLSSALGPLILYEFAIRRVAALRFLFGLKRLNATKRAEPLTPPYNIAPR